MLPGRQAVGVVNVGVDEVGVVEERGELVPKVGPHPLEDVDAPLAGEAHERERRDELGELGDHADPHGHGRVRLARARLLREAPRVGEQQRLDALRVLDRVGRREVPF